MSMMWVTLFGQGEIHIFRINETTAFKRALSVTEA